MSSEFKVLHHFVMPFMGIAVQLDDSVCHHFMAGTFAHCTGLCLLSKDNYVKVNNSEDIFHVFGWGNSVNARNARGNAGFQNGLRDHRERVQTARLAANATNAVAVGNTQSEQDKATNTNVPSNKTA
jgi:hypothetical protein